MTEIGKNELLERLTSHIERNRLTPYQEGFRAAQRDLSPFDCPYIGHRELERREWMRGFDDGYAARMRDA